MTSLSDVLIKGFCGVEDLIAARYGGYVAKEYWVKHIQTEELLCDLLRGQITEDEYWSKFMQGSFWPFGMKTLKRMLSKNLRKEVPGTLDVYERIVAYPRSLYRLNGELVTGRPEIYLVSDHIQERLDEIRGYHPDVFDLISKEFWSCECGQLKRDEGFFPQLLRALGLSNDEVLYVDNDICNITAARMAGISCIEFHNAVQAGGALGDWNFKFATA